jgi:DNA-directed RNA polymerase specialized sigma24 family protein
MSAEQARAAEQLLIDQCLASDEAAWQILYRQQQPLILAKVARLLGRRARSEDLVEEIAALVWCSLLVKDGGRLRRFDPERGGLASYLAALARQQVQLYFRPRVRRRRREVPFPKNGLPARSAPTWSSGMLQAFEATLSPQEKRFFEQVLLGIPGDPPLPPLSPANFRKLKQRVLDKLHAFLYGD